MCKLWRSDIVEYLQGQILIILPPLSFSASKLYVDQKRIDSEFADELSKWVEQLSDSVYLSASLCYREDDDSRLAALQKLAEQSGAPMVATNDILYHHPRRRPLQDLLTCIRKQCTITQAGFELELNAERYLKSPLEIKNGFEKYPDAITKTIEIADRCEFSMTDIRYKYPSVLTRSGNSAEDELRVRTWEGAKKRYSIDKYPLGVPESVKKQINYELDIIEKLKYAPYFLTVYDMVKFARERNILCQGRGSAANSAVCYCLGITEVDPSRIEMLFERFVSRERNAVSYTHLTLPTSDLV